MRLGRAAALWPRTALSVLLTAVAPGPILPVAGRADLMVCTVGGSTCALHGRSLPYAARARALASVVLGTAASSGGLATPAATDSTVVRVATAALLAAAHKRV